MKPYVTAIIFTVVMLATAVYVITDYVNSPTLAETITAQVGKMTEATGY
ncbi:MAG: hypothetical protein AB1411_16005 [Nitrospirota bacterium]